jgi:hypothetical protein
MQKAGAAVFRLFPGTDGGFDTKAKQALEELGRRLSEDCPRCIGPESDLARACSSRLDRAPVPELTGTGPLCRHVPPTDRSDAERQHTAARRGRLVGAGYGERAGLELVPGLRGFPTPPAAWLGGSNARVYPEAANALDEWCRSPALAFVGLLGGVGTGKSFLAACAVAAWSRGPSMWLHAQVVDRPRRWDEVADRAETVALLVLDDLGLERGPSADEPLASRWGRDQLGALMQLRMNRGLHTIVTGNLEKRDLFERYGGSYPERIRSRLALEGLVLPMGVHDLRLARRAAEKRGC